MMEDIDEVLQTLKREGVSGAAIVDKEGNVMESDLPAEVHVETFGIMCATIVGASNSLNSELGRSRVKKTIVDSDTGRIIIADAGEDLVLSVVIGESKRLGVLFDEIENAVERIKQIS